MFCSDVRGESDDVDKLERCTVTVRMITDVAEINSTAPSFDADRSRRQQKRKEQKKGLLE